MDFGDSYDDDSRIRNQHFALVGRGAKLSARAASARRCTMGPACSQFSMPTLLPSRPPPSHPPPSPPLPAPPAPELFLLPLPSSSMKTKTEEPKILALFKELSMKMNHTVARSGTLVVYQEMLGEWLYQSRCRVLSFVGGKAWHDQTMVRLRSFLTLTSVGRLKLYTELQKLPRHQQLPYTSAPDDGWMLLPPAGGRFRFGTRCS